MSLIGIGLDMVRAFGLLLVASAGLGVLIALSNAMQERRYDLAVMRTLGASRRTLFAQPLLEGLLLAAGGALSGCCSAMASPSCSAGCCRKAPTWG